MELMKIKGNWIFDKSSKKLYRLQTGAHATMLLALIHEHFGNTIPEKPRQLLEYVLETFRFGGNIPSIKDITESVIDLLYFKTPFTPNIYTDHDLLIDFGFCFMEYLDQSKRLSIQLDVDDIIDYNYFAQAKDLEKQR